MCTFPASATCCGRYNRHDAQPDKPRRRWRPGSGWPLQTSRPHQLYELLQLRTDVFVMEQDCAFQDMDGADHLAVHLLGTVSVPAARRRSGRATHRLCAPVSRRHQIRRGQHWPGHSRVPACVVTGLGHVLIREAIAAVRPVGRAAHSHWRAVPPDRLLPPAWLCGGRPALPGRQHRPPGHGPDSITLHRRAAGWAGGDHIQPGAISNS
jgi:predicted GNAT family N-acyltransferase